MWGLSAVCKEKQLYWSKSGRLEALVVDIFGLHIWHISYNRWEYCNLGLLVYLDSGMNFNKATLFYDFYSDIRQKLRYDFCTMADRPAKFSLDFSFICGHGRFSNPTDRISLKDFLFFSAIRRCHLSRSRKHTNVTYLYFVSSTSCLEAKIQLVHLFQRKVVYIMCGCCCYRCFTLLVGRWLSVSIQQIIVESCLSCDGATISFDWNTRGLHLFLIVLCLLLATFQLHQCFVAHFSGL